MARTTQQWNDYITESFGGARPTFSSAAYPNGFFPTVEQSNIVYRALLNEAIQARDANGVLVVVNNWEDSNRRLGVFPLPDPPKNVTGYFSSGADMASAAQAKADAADKWGTAYTGQVAGITTGALSVVSREAVESGQITLTPEQRAEYDAAVASSPRAGSVGLSTALVKNIQADAGAGWITAPPAPPLPGTAPQEAPPQGSSSIGGNLPLGAGSGTTGIPGAPTSIPRGISDIGQAGLRLLEVETTTTQGAEAALATETDAEKRKKTMVMVGGIALLAIVAFLLFRK